MPINLDSCITGIFVPGNIGASSGQTPVEPTVPSFEDPDTLIYSLDFSMAFNSFYAGAF